MSGEPAPAAALQALICDNKAAVQHLRESAIPHQIGMAAACRALSLELPRVFSQQLEAELANGAFADQWRASQAAAAEAAGDFDTDLGAVARLVRERVDALLRQISARGKAWVAETYRLQGEADALEAQTARLRRLLPLAGDEPTEATGAPPATLLTAVDPAGAVQEP